MTFLWLSNVNKPASSPLLPLQTYSIQNKFPLPAMTRHRPIIGMDNLYSHGIDFAIPYLDTRVIHM
jgi:hypothetical protein